MTAPVRSAFVIAVILAAVGFTADAQAPRIALVSIRIPPYPPVAESARVSGDVRVTVDLGPDCAVAAVSVTGGDGRTKLLEAGVLEAARTAHFRCDGLTTPASPYALVFAFRFADLIGRAHGQIDPEIVSVSPGESRILIVAETPTTGEGPMGIPRGPARAPWCLWLWHCERIAHDDGPGGPEVTPDEIPMPDYPADARPAMASADVEVTLTVQPDGSVATAEVGTTRNLAGSTPQLRLAFQRSALASARGARFVCERCRGPLPYSIVYAFRFDDLLSTPVRGYWRTLSPTQATFEVPADVPFLEAALNIRADALPAVCSLAPAERAGGDLVFPRNPWASEDRPLLQRVRARMTGRAETEWAPRYEMQLAEGVSQAYVGRYLDAAGAPVTVYGLLIGDADDANAFADLATTRGAQAFVVHRRIVVAFRDRNPCADALGEMLKSRAARR
jgi:hypothetical protein